MPKTSVVLHSGGLDSTTCLLLAQKKGLEVLSLGIDYGQRHRIELEYAAEQCKKYNIRRRLLRVEWDRTHLSIPTSRSIENIKKNVSPAFLPARNILFLTLACAEASGINADEVWIGINAIDFSGYPDCTPKFIQSYSDMLLAGGVEKIKIVAPLINMSKPEIAIEARRLGILHGDTWSCYQPEFSAFGISPCGKCDACVLHSYAWEEAKKQASVL